MVLALRWSRGYRQLCSLWFKYDLCLNRKPPSDHKICLMTLIHIRSMSDPKGLSYDSNMIKKPPSGFGSMPIKRVSIAMSSLVRIRPMFEQEAPKWLGKLFNDADSNTIHVGSQRGDTMIQIWPKATSQWARHFANQMGIDSYVLFGSNTTHVWTGSPQVILRIV